MARHIESSPILHRPAFAGALRAASYGVAAFASAFSRWLRMAFLTVQETGLPSRSFREAEAKAGGAKRDRTADLLHAMQALSQLSYGPVPVTPAMGRRRRKILTLVFLDIGVDDAADVVVLVVVFLEERVVFLVFLIVAFDFDILDVVLVDH